MGLWRFNIKFAPGTYRSSGRGYSGKHRSKSYAGKHRASGSGNPFYPYRRHGGGWL